MVSRKVLMEIYAFVLILVCITMMAVAAVMYFKYGQQYEDFIERELVWTNSLLLMLAIVLAMVIFLGYLGIFMVKESIIVMYAIGLLLIGLALICLGMASFILRTKINGEVGDKGVDIFGDYNDSKKLVDEVQIKLRCCGFINAEELNDNDTYPESCCGHVTNPYTLQPMCLNPYPYGCKDLIIAIVKYPLSVVGSVSFGASILILLGVGLAFYDVLMTREE